MIEYKKDDIDLQKAINAYNALSYLPEKRGEAVQQDYFDSMQEIINELEPLAESDEQKAIFDILRHGKKLEEKEKNEIKKIIEYFQDLHKLECEKTGQKIPQTLFGKQLRRIIRLTDDIELLKNRFIEGIFILKILTYIYKIII
jgi:phenylalanyl-tRNA synthetase alpha subunit